MSETTTEYSTPKTVCDTESYPPQTGDLLGAYLAKLSARVRELEAWKANLHIPLDDARLDELFKGLREVQESAKGINDWIEQFNAAIPEASTEYDALTERLTALEAWRDGEHDVCDVCVTAMHDYEARLTALESRIGCIEDQMPGAAAQAVTVTEDDGANLCEWCCERNGTVRPADVILCDQCNAERERQFAADYLPDTPAVTTPPACFRCKGPLGNKPILLSDDEDGWACEKCRGELYGNPQQEAPAVTTPDTCTKCGAVGRVTEIQTDPDIRLCRARCLTTLVEIDGPTTPISELSDDGVAELRRWAKAGDAVNQPLLCATCGHAKEAHIYDIDSGAWCNGGTLGKPCQCREFTPVTTPTVTRERTHGRYGTRNLTKSKKVCATCGHAEAYHLNDTDGNPMCRAGTLGKPCRCTEYKP